MKNNPYKKSLAEIAERNKLKKKMPGRPWPMDKKVEVVHQYLVLGNLRMVAALCNVNYDMVRRWHTEPWWKEMEAEIRNAENLQTDHKMSEIVEKALEATFDRLVNGDFVYDQKTGTITRRPAALRDVHRVTVDLMRTRKDLRQESTVEKPQQITVTDQLGLLAKEFAKWVDKGKPKEVLEMVEIVGEEKNAVHEEWEEGLQEGAGVGTQEEAESSEGPRSEELSPENNDGSRESPQG